MFALQTAQGNKEMAFKFGLSPYILKAKRFTESVFQTKKIAIGCMIHMLSIEIRPILGGTFP